MRLILLSLLVSLSFSGAARGQDPAVEKVIGQQIDALRVDDFNRAFSFASPMIQRVFQTPENFGSMVRNGYPMVWRPQELRFLELRDIAGTMWQRIMVTDDQGKKHLLDYQMITVGGDWKINAVHLVIVPAGSV